MTDTDKALNEVVIILAGINGASPRDNLFFEIGRAQMTARLALGSRISDQAQTACEKQYEVTK